MEVFQHLQFDRLRVVMHDGNPWFKAADVCLAIGIKTAAQAVRLIQTLDIDDRKTVYDGEQYFLAVSKAGLHELILRCFHQPEAKNFSLWINHEVLPQIPTPPHSVEHRGFFNWLRNFFRKKA